MNIIDELTGGDVMLYCFGRDSEALSEDKLRGYGCGVFFHVDASKPGNDCRGRFGLVGSVELEEDCKLSGQAHLINVDEVSGGDKAVRISGNLYNVTHGAMPDHPRKIIERKITLNVYSLGFIDADLLSR